MRDARKEFWKRNQNTQAFALVQIQYGYHEGIIGWVVPVTGFQGQELVITSWRAAVPKEYDEETDSDALELGLFVDLNKAMRAVESANPEGISV